ncbi:MAG: 7-carboxy-7-deazaguanine synthase QueE [Elusimicrobiota bacterium]
MTTTFVSEIYASIQGEGPFTGERQIFTRLAGCPLRCNYCDTPESLTVSGHSRMSVEEVFLEIKRVSVKTGIKTVSMTGGEPLTHIVFLKELLPLLKEQGFKIYLETAGIHVDALEAIYSYVNVISMDMKLPSATHEDHWEQHEKFLKVAGEKAFVKVVLEKKSLLQEVEQAVNIIKKTPVSPLLILQPATAQFPDIEPATAEFIARAFSISKQYLEKVFVMTQQHKIWGMR